MNKKKLLFTLGLICVIAAVAMYVMGKQNPNLTELMDFWWIPLPLALICLFLSNRSTAK